MEKKKKTYKIRRKIDENLEKNKEFKEKEADKRT